MSIEIFRDLEQGSDEWRRARAGIVTASEFSTVMAKGKGGAESKTRRTYLMKLAGEILTGEPAESYSNAHMERGHVMEAEARTLYAFREDVDPEIVGFIRNGPKGCSPDSLIGAAGMMEAKSKLPHLHLECLLRDDMPPEHVAQVQGQLWVAEREWCDLVVYWPGLPLVVRRAYRDEAYIRTLAEAVDVFNADLAEIVEKVRRIGGMREAA